VLEPLKIIPTKNFSYLDNWVGILNWFNTNSPTNINLQLYPDEGPFIVGFDKADFNECYVPNIYNGGGSTNKLAASISGWLSYDFATNPSQVGIKVSDIVSPYSISTSYAPLKCNIKI
jgi:hypothetical protein